MAIEEVETVDENNTFDELEDDILGQKFAANTQDAMDRVYSQLEFQQLLLTPDAKKDYPDINRDIVGANLTPEEVAWVKARELYVSQVDYLRDRKLDLTRLKKHINRSIFVALNVSLSRNGFLRERLGTVTTRFIKGQDEVQPKTKLPYGYKRKG